MSKTKVLINNNKKLEVHCTWGDGPDIVIINNNNPYMLYDIPDKTRCTHGISRNGSFDLTKDEAKQLVNDLNMAIQSCEDLEQSCEQYFNENYNNEK